MAGVKCQRNGSQGFQSRAQEIAKQQASHLLTACLFRRKITASRSHCCLFAISILPRKREKASFRKRLLLRRFPALSRLKWFGRALDKYLIAFMGLVRQTSICFEVFLMLLKILSL